MLDGGLTQPGSLVDLIQPFAPQDPHHGYRS
jgi:hypothetical protein